MPVSRDRHATALGAIALAAASCGGTVSWERVGRGGEGGSAASSSADAASASAAATPASSSTAGPAPVCDHTFDCAGCLACAQAAGGPCEGVLAACESDTSQGGCADLYDCVAACQVQGCIEACEDAHTAAIGPFDDLVVCLLCDTCYQDCDGEAQGC